MILVKDKNNIMLSAYKADEIFDQSFCYLEELLMSMQMEYEQCVYVA